MTPEAHAHLCRVDRTMKRLVDKVGPCQLQPQRLRSPFESLVRAVAHQQLTGRVAEVILGRFLQLFPKGRFPKPEHVLALTDPQLRQVGFSRAKAAAILDIAQKTLDGVVPPNRRIGQLADEEIIERLIQVRGVGRWTVEMLLMFQLGRPDVLPTGDFGVRKGFGLAYRKGKMPTPRELAEFGERWKPFRTTASWYLWRACELYDKRSVKKD